jgi:lipid-A-disaccharide synthase
VKILVSAGEVSGDLHGAYLVRELKKLRPDIYFFGMGSEKLAAEGVGIKFDICKRGTIGIFESLPNLLPLYLTFLRMKQLLLKERPDLVLLIDAQGFNLPFARFCKKVGLKTVYYIAPQEWLWGTPRGVKKVSETVDLIIAIFEKEYEIYKSAGGNVVYFGHPLLDIVKPTIIADAVDLVPHPSSIVIALCPGSRTQEIRGLLPLLLKAGELIQKELPGVQFLLPVVPQQAKEVSRLVGNFRVKVVAGQTYHLLSACDLAICASGTINLETSLLGIPNIMVYKLSPLTYWVGKNLLRIGEKLKYFSMPNILLDQKVIPELVMQDATPGKIAEEAISILKDLKRQKEMTEAFKKLRSLLGSPGVIEKCARSILGFTQG